MISDTERAFKVRGGALGNGPGRSAVDSWQLTVGSWQLAVCSWQLGTHVRCRLDPGLCLHAVIPGGLRGMIAQVETRALELRMPGYTCKLGGAAQPSWQVQATGAAGMHHPAPPRRLPRDTRRRLLGGQQRKPFLSTSKQATE